MMTAETNMEKVEKELLPYETRQIIHEKAVPMEEPANEGLMNPKALIFLGLWYFFSALTLFLNKYIVDMMGGDAGLLGFCQMLMTVVGGGVNLYFPMGVYIQSKTTKPRPQSFYRHMILVGGCRFTTVLLGLVALKYVAVSFTETVKSSAPIFTVLIAKGLLGEDTSLLVLCSLIPIMAGLAITSAYELSFNMSGLLAALGTNFTECLQNVYSKMLISGSEYKYTPAEMQFYSALCSMVVQIPIAYLMIDTNVVYNTMSYTMAVSLVSNGLFFHGQTYTAYGLMGYISPVTHSVANTVKRALLIWLSILIFGNPVTLLAAFGMILVTGGVFLYNKAREHDSQMKDIADKYPANGGKISSN